MKRTHRLGLSLLLGTLLTVLLPALPAREKVEDPIALFNGKDLTNFYTFLRGHGKNNDPERVFTVRRHDPRLRARSSAASSPKRNTRITTWSWSSNGARRPGRRGRKDPG